MHVSLRRQFPKHILSLHTTLLERQGRVMSILALCLACLTACIQARSTPPRRVYYELGLNTADHVTVLVQVGPRASERFAAFFRAFSTEFETYWPHYCQGPSCLANQWQITLEEADRGTVRVTLAEQGGTMQTFLWKRFTSEDLSGITLFAKRMVRTVIELLASLTKKEN